MTAQRRLPTWRELHMDTSPEAERMLFAYWRETPAWQKLERASQLNRSARQLALSGLRRRHPDASPELLQRLLADLLLGPPLAAELYGALPADCKEPAMAEPEWLEVTLRVADVLDGLQVPYVIGGSVASIVHGLIRTTMDVDLVADLKPEHVAPLVAALRADFYIDDQTIHQAIERRSSFNLIHLTSMYKVAVFIPKERPFDRQQLRRRLSQLVAGSARTISVLTAEDVILAKLDWFRLGGEVSERQWRDVLGVLKTQGEQLDLAYLQQWAQPLGVSDLLEEALAQLNSA
ncbi:MAG: hypothetical protein ACRDHL_08675 [Candidatus Promineifilaceae bacterium]